MAEWVVVAQDDIIVAPYFKEYLLESIEWEFDFISGYSNYADDLSALQQITLHQNLSPKIFWTDW